MLGSVGILAVIWMFEWVMKKCDLECVWKQRCIEAFRFCSSPRGSGVLDEAFHFSGDAGDEKKCDLHLKQRGVEVLFVSRTTSRLLSSSNSCEVS